MSIFFWIGLLLILWHMYWLYYCQCTPPPEPCKKTAFEQQLEHYFQNVIPFDRDSVCHETLPEFYKDMFEDASPYVGSRRYGDNPPDVFYLGGEKNYR